jgi:hypothetical protein
MIRTKLIAVLAAAGAFALVGCSSNTGGSANPATTAATSAASAASSATMAATSAASSAPAASETSSAPAQSGTTASTDENAPTTTIGNGGLDAQSAAWFDAFCTGMSPLSDASSAMAGAGGSDPKSQLTASVAAFNSIADAFTNTANKLKDLPPPTFEHGAEIASKIVTGLATTGPQIKAAAQTLSQVQATDEAGVQTAIEAAAGTLESAASSLDPGNYALDEGTQNDIKKIPSCAKIGFGANGGATSPTS